MATISEKAKEKGAEFRRDEYTLQEALDRCPWQTVKLREALADGWREQHLKMTT